MPQKPSGVVVPTQKIGGDYNIEPMKVVPVSFKAEQIGATTSALITIQIQINDCKIHKQPFNFNYSDKEAYLAFHDAPAGALKIARLMPKLIKQTEPGDDKPVELVFSVTLDQGKVGGAG